MVAPICSSVQLPYIYLNLSTILVPSGRFNCRSQVSYHILVYYFITRTRTTRLANRKLPSLFRQVLSIVSRRMRRPISIPLVPTPNNQTPTIKRLQSNLDLSLLLLLQLQRVYYC